MELFRRNYPRQFSLPKRINKLGELAYNLWWVWNPDAQSLFWMVDKPLWDMVEHNPVAFLLKVTRKKLNAVTNESKYLGLYDQVISDYLRYIQSTDTWWSQNYPNQTQRLISYFSFEFGLHESLPVYAGGLGILSGDHLKEASDLGMPLVGVGFIYNQGYFSQQISEDGWQETRTHYLKFGEAPVISLETSDGRPLTVDVDLPGRKVSARIWEIRVGRVALYLLDTNLENNSTDDRQLTARLYSNDPDTRISQEILLGVGGVRALRLLGYQPNVWHMNEGHSAFLTLERIQEICQNGTSFDDAARQVRLTNVFTTHTPVPAGNDQFPSWLVDKYFSQYWPSLGLNREQFMKLGQLPEVYGDAFIMPVLALRLSNFSNAVSELHEVVSRRMWAPLWPDRRIEEIPIAHITNGVHTTTWLSSRMRQLFNTYLGPDWIKNMMDTDFWQQVVNIPDEELWNVRRLLRRDLQLFANERARRGWLRGVHPVQVIAGGVMLDPNALTIGFARRFSTYKRGYLILSDMDRLLRLLNNQERPVQIVFAGKAHPADEPGKLIIQQIYRAAKDAKCGGRLVFLEDYDMNIARYIVQGVDIWMNTPRRPNEASGTSGMKAALNGALNFSVLDGWWHEAFNGENGWAIGDETEHPDPMQQDHIDSRSLYDTLEKEIIPLFYSDRHEGVPLDWVVRIKESIRTLAPFFSTRRMLMEYVDQLYIPAMMDGNGLSKVGKAA